MLNCDLFTADKHADVQGFNCGHGPACDEVHQFIVGQNGTSHALKMIQNGRRDIWTYRLKSNGKLVGFGALSKPRPWVIGGVEHDVTVIHAFGVDEEFHWPNAIKPGQSYASAILSDLRKKAEAIGRPYLGLFVRKDNDAAKKFYIREGLILLDDSSRLTHDLMIMKLPIPAVDEDSSSSIVS